MDVHHTCLEEIDDLLKLGEYNEPSLLHKIRERFYKDKICNLIGSQIVLYINPNKIINELENFQNFYQSYKDYFLKIEFEMMKKNVIPEITVDNLYYVTHKSYVDMLLNKFKTQNFIISGESCSGKSHAFRSVLNYLSFLSIEQNSKYDNPLENMIMEINNLLDSFGNASTEINPNSSRFTKYFDIMFNTKGKITALKLYCYFLEKSRVLGTIPNESNFHIFYQLINGSNEFEKKIYHVKEVNYFKYLRKGVHRSTAKEDLINFQRVKEILLKIKFSNDEVKSIFTILAGVLYLGNIEFDMSINNQLQIRDNTIKDFLNASVLLGIDQERLLYVLTKCVKGDKTLLLENAYNNLNKISKILYSKTFNFIIKKINTIITFLDNKNSVDSELKIGILDFFGFEKKVNNGFEQFCRNYANEVLNQYYLNFNFKVQQEEYIKENIPWAKVGFNDNCDLLNLIDDVQDESIFTIIEKNQNENDKLLIRNIDKSVNGKNSKIIIKNNLLLIKHYNGDIEYNTNDFIENNCDFLDNDIKVVFEVANHTLLRSFFKKGPNYITKLLKKKMRKLYKLLYNSGNNIYLNCINPISNNDQENHFESIYVNKQLKSMSIIELLKIKKQSLPIRMNKEVFVSKYFQLMRNSAEIKDKNNVEQIFKDVLIKLNLVSKILQNK